MHRIDVGHVEGLNFLTLNIGGSASENPTFNISPVTGKQFTERVATPFHDRSLSFWSLKGEKSIRPCV